MMKQIERIEHEFDFFEHKSLSYESHPAGFLTDSIVKDSVDSCDWLRRAKGSCSKKIQSAPSAKSFRRNLLIIKHIPSG